MANLGVPVIIPCSPSSSYGVMCRICHEGDDKEELFSFCKCSGSLALAHRSCLEKWLSTANSSTCEICKFGFETLRKPRPVTDWFKQSDRSQTNNFIGDLICFIVLTPLSVVSSYLCVLGASHYLMKRKGVSLEASGLITVAIILATVYCIWFGATIRHHIQTILKWRASHQSVELLSIRNVRVVAFELNNNKTASRTQLV